jgi:hypothetical protein
MYIGKQKRLWYVTQMKMVAAIGLSLATAFSSALPAQALHFTGRGLRDSQVKSRKWWRGGDRRWSNNDGDRRWSRRYGGRHWSRHNGGRHHGHRHHDNDFGSVFGGLAAEWDLLSPGAAIHAGC